MVRGGGGARVPVSLKSFFFGRAESGGGVSLTGDQEHKGGSQRDINTLDDKPNPNLVIFGLHPIQRISAFIWLEMRLHRRYTHCVTKEV